MWAPRVSKSAMANSSRSPLAKMRVSCSPAWSRRRRTCLEISKQVRRRLDQAGLHETRIFASGDLDEFAIADLLTRGAHIDAFGVGTALATSKDAPALSGVYKLVDVESGEGPSYRAKFSQEKATYPGRKQVFRFPDANGGHREDIIACESERYSDGKPRLSCVLRQGQRTAPPPDLPQGQKRAGPGFAKL